MEKDKNVKFSMEELRFIAFLKNKGYLFSKDINSEEIQPPTSDLPNGIPAEILNPNFILGNLDKEIDLKEHIFTKKIDHNNFEGMALAAREGDEIPDEILKKMIEDYKKNEDKK